MGDLLAHDVQTAASDLGVGLAHISDLVAGRAGQVEGYGVVVHVFFHQGYWVDMSSCDKSRKPIPPVPGTVRESSGTCRDNGVRPVGVDDHRGSGDAFDLYHQHHSLGSIRDTFSHVPLPKSPRHMVGVVVDREGLVPVGRRRGDFALGIEPRAITRIRTVADSLPVIDSWHWFSAASREPPTTVHDVRRTVELIRSRVEGSSMRRLRTVRFVPGSMRVASSSRCRASRWVPSVECGRSSASSGRAESPSSVVSMNGAEASRLHCISSSDSPVRA